MSQSGSSELAGWPEFSEAELREALNSFVSVEHMAGPMAGPPRDKEHMLALLMKFLGEVHGCVTPEHNWKELEPDNWPRCALASTTGADCPDKVLVNYKAGSAFSAC